MSSDLRAWVESVSDDQADRLLVALHDDTGAGRCATCSVMETYGDGFGLGTLRAAEWPCVTVRLVASRYRDRPGFRPGWGVELGEVRS